MASRCSTCQTPIIWLRTAAGKRMPVDPGSVQDGDVLFDPARHRSHFADCPQADEHRRPRAQRELF